MTDKCINPSQSRPYLSIRDACNATGLSQYYLRSGCKQGTVPHIMVGSKYLINIPLLLKPQTFDEAKELVDEYIYFYNNERIQLKTGQTPMEVRYAYTA